MDKELRVIEEDIRLAVEVNRSLPSVFKNKYRCPLGALIKPSVEAQEDENLNGDLPRNTSQIEFETWERVCFKWLPSLTLSTQNILWWRCSNLGWNSIARRLKKEGYVSTELHRNTLYRYFVDGLEKIKKL